MTDLLVARVSRSWDAGQAAYAERVAVGSQPQFGVFGGPFDFFDNQNWNAIIAINIVYIALVFVLSKWSAAQEKPLDVTIVMRVYNLICVGLAGYVVYGIVVYKMSQPGPFVCNSLDVDTEAGKKLAFVVWVYYAQKYWEFLDTFIFIFRQSWRQLSFLHVYHHSSITFVTATFCCFDVNGDLYLAALCNSFIHVLMYSHYFLSSFGIKTWYRPHLTKLQLIQFFVCWIQPVLGYYNGPSCGYADWLKVLMIVYQTTMMGLFMNFYMKSYKNKGDSGKKAK